MYDNTVTSKHPPEVVWDWMTDYGPNDHAGPEFVKENGGQAPTRAVERLDGSRVRIKDTAKRYWIEIVVDLADRPNKLPTEGKASMGSWKGLTTVTRTPEGGTKWQSHIEITPERFGARLFFAIMGGRVRKGFVKHENNHFAEFEAAMGSK
jgi:hypothetical protein